MDEGVVYVCTGPRGDLLRNSIGSLRRHNPDLPVHVLADRPYDVPFTWVDARRGMDSRRIKTRLSRYSPFELTLFLDDDTYVAERLDLPAMLGEADVAMARDGMRTAGRAMMKGRTWKRLIREEEATATFEAAGRDHPLYNSGVMVFRRNRRTAAFFERWYEEWGRFGGRDQFALARALPQVQLRWRTLSRRYNRCVTGGRRRLPEDGSIYHLLGKGRSAQRLGVWDPLPPGPFERAFDTATRRGPLEQVHYQRIGRELHGCRPCSLLVFGTGDDADLWHRCTGGDVWHVVGAGQAPGRVPGRPVRCRFEEHLTAERAGAPPAEAIGRAFDYALVGETASFHGGRFDVQRLAIDWAAQLARKAVFVVEDRPGRRGVDHPMLGPPAEVWPASGSRHRRVLIYRR